MGIFDRFPYSSTHEMNLDFMLGKATEIAESLQTVQDGLSDIDTHKAQAEQAAQAAQASQAAASASAGQAAQHKTDAEDAADRAESASTEAETAADRAETALGNITNAETVCTEAAEEAQQYAEASQTHSGQAQIYKNAAEAAKNSAELNASQAATSAGSAANSATDAASSANSANVSATNASLQASNASTSAANAATSETNAAASASAAAASEEHVEKLVESLPEDFTNLNNEVTDLKSAFDVIETKIDEVAVYPNLANPNAFTTDKYVAPDGSIYASSGLSYSGKIAVSTGQIIKANHRARFIAAYNGNTVNAEAGVNDQTVEDAPTTYTVPEGITDLVFTFRNGYLSDLIIYVYDGVDYGYIPYGKVSAIRTSLLPVPLGVYAERKNRSVFVDTSDISFLANTFISLPVFCSTRKNSRLVYRAQIASLGNFEIGFTTSAISSGTKYNRFVIRQNEVIAYTHYDYTQSAMYSEEIQHDLNITIGLLEVIIEELPDAKVKITIGNNGNTFVHTFDDYVKNNTLQPYCYSAYSSFSNYKFTWSCTDLYKDIWFFGDSYMAYSEARWAYYLEEYGYAKNTLINSFPGCWSSTAVTALNNLITHGNPDFAVWALGMNDGTDSENAPSTAWANGRDSFLAVCEANYITPIFCTIPTVPTINHEQKNAWIRSSGYRYIDFAKAVNAKSNGTWNSGMLSGDGVHPTVNGAKALFSEVLLDFPEIMLD